MMNEIVQGDALEVLKTLESESVNCVVTSPPYYGLRDYGVEGQIGLEPTYQEFISNLCRIFDEVKRVLKKDGTCFVNLGDTFMGNSSYSEKGRQGLGNDKIGMMNKKQWLDPKYPHKEKLRAREHIDKIQGEIKTKSLMMIPERFAIEMINRGWILRNKLVWIKRNAMPESVQDRWKKAHEYIFFFTKSQKYYFDLDSIRTPHRLVSLKRAEYEQGRNALGQNPSSVGDKYSKDKSDKYGMPARVVKLNDKGAVPPDFLDIFTNSGEDGAIEHYATYPQTLISPLIRAGSKEGDIILDPFFGSGTTGLVALKLGRKYIGIDLSEEYCKIAEERLKAHNPLF